MENPSASLCPQAYRGLLGEQGFPGPKSVLEQQMEVLETVGLPAISLTGSRMTGLGWCGLQTRQGLVDDLGEGVNDND